MNKFIHSSKFLSVRVTSTIIFIFLLLILFVYPSPNGLFFQLLKLIILVTFGYIYYNLFSHGKAWDKGVEKQTDIDSQSDDSPSLQVGSKLQIDISTGKLSIINNFISVFYSDFNTALYLIDENNNSLILRENSEKSVLFSSHISLSNGNLKPLLNINDATFFTPHTGIEDVKPIFIDSIRLPDSVTVLISPVKVGNNVVGLIAIQGERFGDFEETDKEMANYICEMIANALTDTNAVDLLRYHNAFLSDLLSFQEKIEIQHEKSEVLNEFVRFCKRWFFFDKLTITCGVDGDPNKTNIEIVSGLEEDYEKGTQLVLDDSIHGKIITEGSPVLCKNLILESNVKGRFREGDLEDPQIMSLMGIPLKDESGIRGALILESFGSNKYSQPDLQNLIITGQNLGRLLKWSKDYSIIKRTASHDGLTGLINHKAFADRFAMELNRAKRYQENLVLIMLDLDKFKRINDTYGHLYGDFVLKETANILKDSIRNVDIAARYGGEEFTIILINANAKDTYLACKRIVSNIAEYNFDKDDVKVRMTISAGVSEFPTDGTTARDLIARADEAMYRAKRAGGNDVGYASTLSS